MIARHCILLSAIALAAWCAGTGLAWAESPSPQDVPAAAASENTPPTSPLSTPAEAPAASSETKPRLLKFNFRYQPWADVLDWFAEQAGYSLVLDAPPSGTFNYRDDRAYTPAEAIDVLNSVLLTKGYTLVVRDRMLMLVHLDDEIPPSMIARVTPDELDQRGKYELVSTRFQLKNLNVAEARKEIDSLLGPQGRVVELPKAQQLLITEMGGRLREIRDVLARADGARDLAGQEVRWFELTSVSPDEAVAMLRQILEMPQDATATADGTLRLATAPIGMRLLASGTPQRRAQVAKVMQTIDAPVSGEAAEPGQQAAPQLEVYDVAPADPESVLKVMQTLLADIPGVRLATDPKTGNLIALARPKEQATVRATIDQIRRDAQSVEVIQLRVIDPQLAVLAIGKLFGAGKDSQQAPSIDADVANRQLLVRGSAGQIAQIRMLLEKMGETFGAGPSLAQGKLRVVPVRGGDAQEILDRLREFWPVMGGNELRVVPVRPAPRRGAPGSRPPREGPIDERTPVPGPAAPSRSPALSEPAPSTTWIGPSDRAAETPRARVTLAAAGADRVDEGAATPSQGTPSDIAKPPILVLTTPEGLYLSSEDVAALDELQKLIDVLQGGSTAHEPKLTVFYLRNAEAKTVADRLKELLANTTSTAAATAPAAAPGTTTAPAPAGMLGSLGMAGTLGRITPLGPISITPDPRLNALLVQAAPADVDLIEEILKILDRRDSPEEVPAQPKPRLIPVVYTSASEIATVVKQVYATRLAGNSDEGNDNRGLSPPEMMMRMWRRGRGGDDSSSRSTKDTQAKMSIGVDSRTNSLIVSAPEPLFEEVRELVAALDRVASQDQETVQVVTLRESNPEAVRAALAALLGDAVQTSTTSSAAGRGSIGSSRWGGAQPSGNPSSGFRNRSSGQSSTDGSSQRPGFQAPQSPQRGQFFFGRPQRSESRP